MYFGLSRHGPQSKFKLEGPRTYCKIEIKLTLFFCSIIINKIGTRSKLIATLKMIIVFISKIHNQWAFTNITENADEFQSL